MLAVSGAAAFAGVITKTTSPILILLEMTGDMEYLPGLLITLLVSNSIASIYIMSFFDTVLNIKKYAALTPDCHTYRCSIAQCGTRETLGK